MDIMPKTIDKSWEEFINNEKNIEVLKEARKNIGNNFYPEKKNVLRFLNTNLDNSKCVLMGMDPYKQSYTLNKKTYPVATGRSFEVANLNSWQDPTNRSLTNILKKIYSIDNNVKGIKEIRKEIKNNEFEILEPNKLFDNLENQGVIFLNSSLTLLPNKSGSHIKYWKDFIDLVITYINDYNPDTEWLLFGKKAQERVLPLIDEKNAIIASHPVKNSFITEPSFEKVKSINWKGI